MKIEQIPKGHLLGAINLDFQSGKKSLVQKGFFIYQIALCRPHQYQWHQSTLGCYERHILLHV